MSFIVYLVCKEFVYINPSIMLEMNLIFHSPYINLCITFQLLYVFLIV